MFKENIKITEKPLSQRLHESWVRPHEVYPIDYAPATIEELEIIKEVESLEAERDQYKRELQTAMEVGTDLVKGGLMPFKKQLRDLEAEVTHWKQDWNRVAKERNDALDRLAKAQELRQLYAKRLSVPHISVGSWSLSEPQFCILQVILGEYELAPSMLFKKNGVNVTDEIILQDAKALGGFESPSPATCKETIK